MSIAPSEKHLEDWIVDTGYFTLPQAKILRQYQLPSGIIDLIYLDGNGLQLIELKKGRIDSKALMQTARYLRDLNGISKTALDLVRPPLDRYAQIYDPKLTTTLIGYGVKEDNLLIAAQAIGIDIVSYEYDSNQDSYEFFDVEAPPLLIEDKIQYVTGDIGMYIQEAFTIKQRDMPISPEGVPLHAMLVYHELFTLETKYGIKPFYDDEGAIQ